ncbi:uncharacterized protein LOC18430886 [Amborella trichopoda]|uniref:uncharacterized protein LOC18430886 n=1 Tax=Amborella trichopoda TaxID=13333 RepID=UPI0005D33915|nr:uncharacterized protein LOC18430886 [Amborella trichopoda]|eukprot:XP_011622155.1 uncharacterized protein LOC18430886 [Amborella trichopoda]
MSIPSSKGTKQKMQQDLLPMIVLPQQRQCFKEPKAPLYGGGIIVNPSIDHGLKASSVFGDAKVEKRSINGNQFIVAPNRLRPHDSASQGFNLERGKLYALSGWIQINEGSTTVNAVIKTADGGFIHCGGVSAKSGCWSMLKGGLEANYSGLAELYFESQNIEVEIWVDNVSLQPFSEEEWRAHQTESIEKGRKKAVKLEAVNVRGKKLQGANVILQQTRPHFPFGSAIGQNILSNPTYQNWWNQRFTVTTFENELKWYSTESTANKENYSVADAMFAFTRQHGIPVRGHNIFWDDPKYQPSWVPQLNPDQLRVAAEKRLNSVVNKYKGQVIAWDVMNENLHFHFYEDRLGSNITDQYFQKVGQIDEKATLFMNDYNTLEQSEDHDSTPDKYIGKLKEIQAFLGNNRVPLGIGLESHFQKPNMPYVRATLDLLGATGLPVWITELDVTPDPNQAQNLEAILRETYSHPYVQGIIMWTGWHPEGCYNMCLTDNNFKNLPTGDVVDKLIKEWGIKRSLVGKTDRDGIFETLVPHGKYEIIITNPNTNSSSTHILEVTMDSEEHHVQVYA